LDAGKVALLKALGPPVKGRTLDGNCVQGELGGRYYYSSMPFLHVERRYQIVCAALQQKYCMHHLKAPALGEERPDHGEGPGISGRK
jgi:hypothetical protein